MASNAACKQVSGLCLRNVDAGSSTAPAEGAGHAGQAKTPLACLRRLYHQMPGFASNQQTVSHLCRVEYSPASKA